MSGNPIGISEVADKLGVPVAMLQMTARRADALYSRGFRRFAKKTRFLHVPKRALRPLQRSLVSILFPDFPVSDAAMARRGAGVLTNARRHLGADFLSLRDVTNCYHSITPAVVAEAFESYNLSPEAAGLLTRLTTVDGLLPQGAPTSPGILDMVLRDFDAGVLGEAEATGLQYTRYADDLCWSCKSPTEMVLPQVDHRLAAFGLTLNPEKSRDWGPREIKTVTGIVVSTTLAAEDSYVEALSELIQQQPIQELRRHRQRILGMLSWVRQVGDPRAGRLSALLNKRLAGARSRKH